MMSDKKHILICGERGIGKSTLIEKLLKEIKIPIYGFFTKRLAADETGFHPIYIHEAGEKSRSYEESNLIGTCDSKIHNVTIEVFDTLGAKYIKKAKPGGIIVMDELGFMEAKSEPFVNAVKSALQGDIPVIAAVKSRFDVPFLNEVRSSPKAELYMIDEQNRNELYEKLLPIVRKWNNI